METPETPKTWNRICINISWRADRHTEDHIITFKRPVPQEPSPEYPVIKGKYLPYSRLPMSSEWGQLFCSIKVVDFDEHSLTLKYGSTTYELKPDCWKKLGSGGMSYTSFDLYVVLQYQPYSLSITHDEPFLRRFRFKQRIMSLTEADVEMLRYQASLGDVWARYGYVRWQHYHDFSPENLRMVEQSYLAIMDQIPEARVAYADMLCYGETEANTRDLDECVRLISDAAAGGNEFAQLRQVSSLLNGIVAEANPAQAAADIEAHLKGATGYDPNWIVQLAYAYEDLGRIDDAIAQHEKAIALGEGAGCYSLAQLYQTQGDKARYTQTMLRGIELGNGLCFTYQEKITNDDYNQLDPQAKEELHKKSDQNLNAGLRLCEGWCAYYLWFNLTYGQMGYGEDVRAAQKYLDLGVKFGHGYCMLKKADLAEADEWSEELSPTEIAELRLQAVRYLPFFKEALQSLSKVTDPAFLLRHKEELDRYWRPRFPKPQAPVAPPPAPVRTPVEPTVIIIEPTGHLRLVEADVCRIRTFRKMGQTLIGADGLDAVHFSPLLQSMTKAAGLDLSLVMYSDREAQMKQLPDNAIGTMIYGQGQEILGPIIICLEDKVYDCHSFKTHEDLVAVYAELKTHFGNLLTVREEDAKYLDANV